MPIALMNGAELHYTVVEETTAESFAKLFRITWGLLPAGIRRVLQLHWAERATSPRISLSPFDWNPKQGNVAGRVSDNGHSVEFNSLLFALATEEHFSAAIVHELSHIFFVALCQPQHTYGWTKADKVATEILAIELTRRMDFRQDEVLEWLNCEVSVKGPYLRKDQNEAIGVAADFWTRWSQLEELWARDNRAWIEGPLESVKASFIAEHSPYFESALKTSGCDWTQISQVISQTSASS